MTLGIVLATLALDVAAGFMAFHSLRDDRQRYESLVELTTRDRAAALDKSIAIEVEAVDITLWTVLDELERRMTARGTLDGSGLDARIEQLRARLPGDPVIRVSDAAGKLIFGTDVAGSPEVNWSDRPFFQALRERDDRRLWVTAPLMGRLSRVWLVAFSRRYNTPDGRFAGVVSIAQPARHILELLSTESTGTHGVALLRNLEGRLILRYPESTNPDQQPGTARYSRELELAIRSGQAVRTYHAEQTGDGVERINTFRRLRSVPFFLVVGEATQDFLAPWNLLVRRTIAAVAVFWILSGIAAWLLQRAIASLRRENQRNLSIEAQFRRLLDVLPEGVVVHQAGSIRYLNRHASRLLRLPDTPVGQVELPLSQLGSGPSGPFIEVSGVPAGSARSTETKVDRADGSQFDAEVSAQAISFQDAPATLVLLSDVSEQKRYVEQLRLASSVYENTGEAILVTDRFNRVVSANAAFCRLTGMALPDVRGQHAWRLFRAARVDTGFRSLWRAVRLRGEWQGEVQSRRPDGSAHTALVTITTIRGDRGLVQNRVCLFSDITERKKSDEVIWRQANLDVLTGLPNRRLFHDRLGEAMKRVPRADQSVSLMVIDLDRFKEINDTMGHVAGDQLLVEAARRISSCVRGSDTVARLGGDEFALILPGHPSQDRVALVAQAIIEKLAVPFSIGTRNAYVSASVGIALYPADAPSADELFRNADQAMYEAKARGRNGFVFFTEGMQRRAKSRIALTNDLRLALVRQEMAVWYQPIVDLATGRVVKAEALLRWNHPVRGLVGPAEFISLAEESGQILALGDWVFEQAIESAAGWYRRFGRLIQVSVNKSPLAFNSERIAAPWEERLDAIGFPGSGLAVEITEGVLMRDSPRVRSRLIGYRNRGIEVSIDDFGTGFSSLSYLRQFDVDYLKIDRSFVANLPQDPSNQTLTEAIVVMAHKLGIRTVAEGVETAAQRESLARMGCDFGQGFAFSKPLPEAEFEQLLARDPVL